MSRRGTLPNAPNSEYGHQTTSRDLGWDGHQPKRTAGTELHVRDLNPPEKPANQQTFFTPVELKSLASAKVNGTKARKDFACSPRHARMKAVSWL